VIYAGTRGYLDTIPTNKIGAYQTALLSKLKSSNPEILDGIRTKKDLTAELEAELKDILAAFVKTFA